MSSPWVSNVSFYVISRDPLVVVAPQEHPSCRVLQVRGLGEGIEGPRCRAKALQPLFLSSAISTGHLGVRDLGGKRPVVRPVQSVRRPQPSHSSALRKGQAEQGDLGTKGLTDQRTLSWLYVSLGD